MKIKSEWAPSSGVRILGAELVGEKWQVSGVCCGSTVCPDCAATSSAPHSSYIRRLQDLPDQGREVVLEVRMQRWRCRNPSCDRQTFGSRLPAVAGLASRRTHRVADLMRLIGHAVGGRPAERLMKRLAMAMSDDTILRGLKRAVPAVRTSVRVVGIDDWAWMKGRTYGTLIVDLERRQVVDLLADRSAASTAAWFRQHPEVEIVSRDRCGIYAQGATQGAPQARQIADRFHLLQNLRDAVERQMSRGQIPNVSAPSTDKENGSKVASAAVHNPPRRSRAAAQRDEAAQFRRTAHQLRFDKVKALQETGQTLNDICRETGLNWRTGAKWCNADRLPVRNRMLPSLRLRADLEDHLSRRWQEGEKSGRVLHEEIQALGYSESRATFYRVLAKWKARHEAATGLDQKPAHPPQQALPPQPPEPIDPGSGHLISPIIAAALCMKPRALLTANQIGQVAVLKSSSKDFGAMRRFAMRFRGIMRGRNLAKLTEWITELQYCGIHAMQSFARTLKEDLEAVRNAISEPWSNGQAEGQINRLKTIKRTMYGRAGVELLRARMLPLGDLDRHTC